MDLILPAAFGITSLASVRLDAAAADALNSTAPGKAASRLALSVAKLLLAAAFILGLASTIAAST
jgi:hypothetical protein